MQQPDGKVAKDGFGTSDETVRPDNWQQVLRPAAALVATSERRVPGFFFEVVPDHDGSAGLEAAPVLLVINEPDRFVRPTPLHIRHLASSPRQPLEQRLAVSVLGLP